MRAPKPFETIKNEAVEFGNKELLAHRNRNGKRKEEGDEEKKNPHAVKAIYKSISNNNKTTVSQLF